MLMDGQCDAIIRHFFQNVCLILCILMDFPIQINAIRMELSIIYFKGSQVEMFKEGGI